MKYLFFLILFCTYLFSADINKYNNVNSFLISENGQAYKQITYKEYKKRKIKDFTIKIGIDKSTLKESAYYLTIITDPKSIKSTNVQYLDKGHMIVIKLDSSIPAALYFEYSYDQPKRAEFRFNVVSEFEYRYILPFEGILYGLAYGIIFSAFIYYLVIYFSTRRVCFLYYSIMQFFVLLSLIGFTYFSFKSYPPEFEQALVDVFESLAFLFTFLFAKEILDAKRQMPYINHALSFFAFLNLLDIFGIFIFKYSLLYDDMYFYMCFLLPTIAGLVAIYKGDKNAIFYTLGWFVIFCFVFSYEHDLIPLSGIYTIHIAAPMESLIFSFALAYMLKQLVKKQNEQEKMLIHKSKLASVGEMINNIAHQWRQPLMHLGYINMNLEMSSQNNEFEKDFFVKKIKESNSQIKFMSKTIDDFRDFYKIQKEKEDFKVSNAASLAVNIISPTLKKKKIDLKIDIKEDITIKGYENEYAQVILNFLSNSVDVLLERKIESPTINIEIDNINNNCVTKVYDNAGGIEEEYLNEIFNPYFTTKRRGSGIGLYMSQLIIQTHFNGDINVKNQKDGACFIIEIYS